MIKKDTKCMHCGYEWTRRTENPHACAQCNIKTPNSIIDIVTGKVIQGYTPYNNKQKPMEEKQITQQEETKEIKDNTFKLRGPVNV